MASSEQDDYVSAHPNLTILDAPGVDGSIPVELLTKLWENPNPGSTFTDTSLSLSSSDYDFILAIARFSTSVAQSVSVIVPKGISVLFSASIPGSGGASSYYRALNYNSNTLYGVGSCQKATGTTASTVDNNGLIPIAIYGIKSTINVDVSAVISDVSTSADKCMLSDGVTSVEDKLDIITDTTSVSNVIFSKSGNVVTIILNGYLTSSTNPQFTVPLQFRPVNNNYILTVVYNYTDKVACFFDIGTGGTTRVRSLANADIASKNIYGTLTYVI